jgi:soluble epoxide hydrolase / lipid-phosphate phosphatase
VTERGVTEHVARSGAHVTAYLAAGPEDGPLVIFAHGWPELAISWRHQLPMLASLGFRAVAPDMRGYGRSTVYPRHEDYAQELIVRDMIDLLEHLGRKRAVWVGHDWGSPVVWNIASHHPECCFAVANLCVPYRTIELGLDATIALVDRKLYPADQYPAGQWDYMRYYEESFAAATAAMEANVYNSVKLFFRKGDPSGFGKPSFSSMTRRRGGSFGGGAAPDVPRDADVVTEEDLRAYAAALTRNGFFGPNSYYMNHDRNAAYGAAAKNGGKLDMPVLFIAARYDYVCEAVTSNLAAPMREFCSNLTETVIDGGHWLAQEKPREVNADLVHWLATCVPEAWTRR